MEGKLFVVTGATSGFGKSIALALVEKGAQVIINARGEEKLNELSSSIPDQLIPLPGDITTDATISKLLRLLSGKKLDGALINAGGPPAKSFIASELEDWDNAYRNVLRWKVKLTKELLNLFKDQSYGRLLYIESVSVLQPIDNLVLSNSLRMAVVGFVKTLSMEVANENITANILAPGYHATPAMERLFIHKSQLLGISPDEAKREFLTDVKSGELGNPDDLASLAVWLLSEQSRYVTGQTISIDGGLMKGI